jgi:hypothetical protein
LSPRSIAYALSVLGAIRCLIVQRYVLANPFAGVKVRGAPRAAGLDASQAFTAGAVSLGVIAFWWMGRLLAPTHGNGW